MLTSHQKFEKLLSLQGGESDCELDEESAKFLFSLVRPPGLGESGFSLGLIKALLGKDKVNAFGLMEPFTESGERSVRAYGIYGSGSLFNHDCLRNACMFDYIDGGGLGVGLWIFGYKGYIINPNSVLLDFGYKMTTSVGNNSVLRSFFEKQKLTGPNFIDWYRQLRLVLSIEDKENYLEHSISAAPVAPPGQQIPPAALAAHVAWVKGQKEVDVLMLLTMDLEIQRNLAHLGAYDMLQELKAMYSKQAEQELLQTVREFHTSKQEEGQSVSSHVLKMKGYIENLERLGQPVGQNLAVSLIVVSLNKDFDSFVQNYNMHGMGKTVNELHAMLKLHEEKLPKKDANPALHAIRAGRVQKNQKNKSHKASKGSHGKGKGKMGNASNNASFASKPKT
nr:zinc finger, CCHC-type [Tanacetum cinerariifolium]